ncbi:MAG: hypothetical protein KAR21_23735, partial [Spirochaetales bacterium]|nr:hypothetical protein [Spirochaetales bacterium]
MGVRKDWNILPGIIQKAIDTIPQTEKDYIYNRWIGGAFEQERPINYNFIWELGIVIFVIIGGILVWNRNLKINVNKKTKELNIYQNKLEDLVKKRTDELENANKELLKAKIAAEEASLAKSRFLSHMSHELRTPLNAILGYSQILAKDKTIYSHHKKPIDTIARSGDHLLILIDNVLEMSKIEAGKININTSSFDLLDLSDELLTFLRIKAEEKGLKLLLENDPNLERYIKSDLRLIREILINLLENAVKFTESGSVVLRVGTERKKEKLRLIIEVEDTGPGIEKEMLTSIFDIFETTAPRETKKTGTGLGLTISRQFSRILGGDLVVSSRPGFGSVFSLNIPVETGETVIPRSHMEQFTNIKLAEGQAVPQVLIVDDVEENRDLLEKIVQNWGMKT